jgi:hypothetical protein
MTGQLKMELGHGAIDEVSAPKRKFSDVDSDDMCPICCEAVTNAVFTPCGHRFCERCLERVQEPRCPMCRNKFRKECVTKWDGTKFVSAYAVQAVDLVAAFGTLGVQDFSLDHAMRVFSRIRGQGRVMFVVRHRTKREMLTERLSALGVRTLRYDIDTCKQRSVVERYHAGDFEALIVASGLDCYAFIPAVRHVICVHAVLRESSFDKLVSLPFYPRTDMTIHQLIVKGTVEQHEHARSQQLL